jgi:HK97 family phage portal protein
MALFGITTTKEMQRQMEAVKAENAALIQKAIDDALKAQAAEFPKWLLETADSYSLRMPDPSVYGNQADLYRKLSWVLSACEITAQFAATAKFSVSRIIADKEPRDIPNHPFEMLLRKPNPLDGRYSFLVASFISYKLTGNCYWWMNKPTPDSPPEELWFIPSHMIIPIPDKQMYVAGYYYYPENGKEMILLPDEILHIRRFNPANRFVGLSAIESLAITARGDLAMQEWNTNLFGDGNGQLRGVLAFQEMVNDSTWADIKRNIREAGRKREHMLLRGVGVGGVNWMQNAVSQKEMEFLEGRKFNKEEIWTVLAPGLYSMLSENATEANSRTGQSAFKDLTVFPMHTMLNEEITNKILPFYGSPAARPLVGAFEDVRGEDRELKLKEIERFEQSHTIDEVREEYYGDDPIGDERGKLLIIQVNAQSGGIQEPEPPPAVPGQGEMPGQPTDAEPQPADEKADDEPKPPTRAQKAVLELNTWQRKAVKDVGKRVKFAPEFVTEEVSAYVNQFLPGCTSNSAVKSVFDNARRMVDPDSAPKAEPPKDDGLILLARSLDGIAAKMTQAKPLTLDAIKALLDGRQPNIDITPIINVPENRTTIHMPRQDAPVSNVYLSPTVEASKPADVRVDAPVHVHNAAAEAPVVNIQNTTNVPEQGAPVVNIDNHMPQQPAPEVAVKNEFTLPEQAAPVVNVTNQVNPTPVEVRNDVTVQPADVNVDMPKPKRQKQKIKRDGQGLIDETDTEIEY